MVLDNEKERVIAKLRSDWTKEENNKLEKYIGDFSGFIHEQKEDLRRDMIYEFNPKLLREAFQRLDSDLENYSIKMKDERDEKIEQNNKWLSLLIP